MRWPAPVHGPGGDVAEIALDWATAASARLSLEAGMRFHRRGSCERRQGICHGFRYTVEAETAMQMEMETGTEMETEVQMELETAAQTAQTTDQQQGRGPRIDH